MQLMVNMRLSGRYLVFVKGHIADGAPPKMLSALTVVTPLNAFPTRVPVTNGT